MYKYEMHCHTSSASACAKSSPEEMADFYKKAGYDGLIITDHFFNGNCSVSKHLPWEQRVKEYVDGYKHAKIRGDQIGLDVFFGIELSYLGTDFLVYGVDQEWLNNHPYCDKYSATEFSTVARNDGALFIQAHPFREANYIEMIKLLPRNVDAVETLNACRTDFENQMADLYAENYGLIKTAGTDNHNCQTREKFSAVLLEEKANDIFEIINAIKENRHKMEIKTREELLK